MPETPELNDSLARMEEELNKLKPAVIYLSKAEDTLKDVLEKSETLFNTIADKASGEFNALKNDVAAEIKQVKDSLVNFTEEHRKQSVKFFEKTKESTDKVIAEADELTISSNQLCDIVQKLIDKLEKIDFDTKFEKLDATVSGINIGVQNLQSQFNSIENNIKAEISRNNKEIERNIKDELNGKAKEINSGIQNVGKSQKLTFSFMVVLNILIIAGLIWIFFR